MNDIETLIQTIYAAFNRRDVDGALVHMSEDVSWPKASEGGKVVGKDEIRAYWSRQWREFDPYVDPLEIVDRGAGTYDVRVRQVVKSLDGDVLADDTVHHVYTIAGGLVEAMHLPGEDGDTKPSAAFAKGDHAE